MKKGILQKAKSIEKYVLQEGKNEIGRSGSCFINISGDIDISRLHAVIEKIDGEFYLYDSGSKHGTWWKKRGILNTFSRLENRVKQTLSDGDRIRFAHLEYEFKLAENVVSEQVPDSIVTSDLSFFGIDDDYKQNEPEIQEIVGHSSSIKKAIKNIRKIAPADLISVLLLGETGTGKGLLARVIHNQSPRHQNAFITLNCAGITSELANSELFGHEKGAFTGALKQRIGYFERANGGTLFLDEIGDMPPDTQSKLLRVLENGEFERVGGEETLTVDVRIVAATNCNLEESIKEKKFREDLFYRIKGCQIDLPALRERIEDIPLLIQHFVNKLQIQLNVPPLSLTPAAIDYLQSYSWPGNIRELYQLIQSAIVCAESSVLDSEFFSLLLQPKKAINSDTEPSLDNLSSKIQSLIRNQMAQGNNPKIIERKIDYMFAKSALDHCDGNKSEVSRVFGMSRTTLDKRLSFEM